MHGNRDFLLGARFCAATGCRLLGDYERVDLYGKPVLLTHGDLLCTDDTRYMGLRGNFAIRPGNASSSRNRSPSAARSQPTCGS